MLGCTRPTRYSTRARLLQVLLVALVASAVADLCPTGRADELPTPYVPLKPPTRRDLDRRESLKQYVLGLLLQRDDQLLAALKAFQDAARLDPEAPAVFKVQVPILLTLGRDQDTLAAIDKVLELDPSDGETWFVAARLHKSLGNPKEAKRALMRGLDTPGLQEHPDVAQQMYLDLAGLHEMAEELPQALKGFIQAAKILDHPDVLMEYGSFNRDMIVARASETHERIGNLLRKLKRYDEAVAAFKKAQAAVPERGGRLNFNLAQLLQEQGKLAEALVYLDQYLRLQPLELEAYEMKIAVLEKLKKEEAIVPWLEQASRGDPNNVGLKIFLAKQYARGGQFGQAEKLFMNLAEASPNPDVYRGLFRLYQEQPNVGMSKTLAMLDKAIEQATNAKGPPGLPAQQAKAMIGALRDDGALAKELVRVAFRQAERVTELRFDTLHLLAVLADKHQKLDEAERFYRQSLRSSGPGTEALVYGGLLRVLWKEHKYEDVVQVCREALQKVQGASPVFLHGEMARAQARLGKTDEALQSAERALQVAGDADKLILNRLRVSILIQAERFDEAEKDCRELLKQFRGPGDSNDIHYLLSNVYSASRQMAKAEQELENILKTDPNNATVNNDLGYIWADQNKNLDKAEEMVRLAIELDRRQRKLSRDPAADEQQDNAAYIDSLGWVYFRQGKLEDACRELERSSALPDGADDPTVWDHLGDVYFRLQRAADARSAWEKSARLFEKENRRRMDERHKEVLRKLKEVGK